MALEFTFGDPYHIRSRNSQFSVEVAHPSVLIGPKTHSSIDLVLQGNVESFVVVFQPAGLNRLFPLASRDMVDQHFHADSVFGSSLADLRVRLAEKRSFVARAEVADQYFMSRMSTPARFDVEVLAAREIVRRRGCVRIADLAFQTGLCTRQLERRFANVLGMPPKLYARIVRFEAALQENERSPTRTWTTIAHELNYCDQTHMVRDFNELSGESPSVVSSRLECFREISINR